MSSVSLVRKEKNPVAGLSPVSGYRTTGWMESCVLGLLVALASSAVGFWATALKQMTANHCPGPPLCSRPLAGWRRESHFQAQIKPDSPTNHISHHHLFLAIPARLVHSPLTSIPGPLFWPQAIQIVRCNSPCPVTAFPSILQASSAVDHAV
jgi:hypothetical protein